jgi:hypothetical protein
MNQIVKAKFDLSRLMQVMARWGAELRLTKEQVLRQQAGLLMQDLVNVTGPKSLEHLGKQIDRDTRKVFAPMPKIPLEHQRGRGFVWLLAGPDFLIGTQPINMHTLDSVDDLERIYRTSNQLTAQIKEKSLTKIGMHGKQDVYRWNRLIVARKTLSAFQARQKLKGGAFKAAWALAWDTLRTGSRLASWVRRHIDNRTAKGSYIDMLSAPGKSFFTFINRSPGSTDERNLQKFRAALIHRTEAMLADLKNQMRGAYRRAGFKHARTV